MDEILAFYDEVESGPIRRSECVPGQKLACCFTVRTLRDGIWQDLRRTFGGRFVEHVPILVILDGFAAAHSHLSGNRHGHSTETLILHTK